MSSLTRSIIFACISGSTLAGVVLTHVIRFKMCKRTPVVVLRLTFSISMISAAVGMLLFCEYLAGLL